MAVAVKPKILLKTQDWMTAHDDYPASDYVTCYVDLDGRTISAWLRLGSSSTAVDFSLDVWDMQTPSETLEREEFALKNVALLEERVQQFAEAVRQAIQERRR